jgi:membrane-bound metal-dependent hydrolase YbcI (DUF457 family)
MPSSLTHGLIAIAAGSAAAPRPLLRPYLITGPLCAVALDLDAIGRLSTGGDVEWLGGHRALTHSLPFTAMVGLAAALATLLSTGWAGHRMRFGVYVACAAAAHGALDALAPYGEGVQFFSPFSLRRYTAPWHPMDPLVEIVVVIPALVLLTREIWRRRGVPWLWRSREKPLSIGPH